MAGNSEETIVDTVLLKVASRCNINCSYCYVFHMGDTNYRNLEKLMSRQTMEAVCVTLKKIKDNQLKAFSVVLHGGEPLLLGADNLALLLQSLRENLPGNYPISIQTNGILLSNAILDICAKFQVSVAISLDGPKHIHDKERIGYTGKGTFDEVMRGYRLLQSHHYASFLNAGLLAVVDPVSDPAEVYYFLKSTGAPSVDFLYKDGNHSRLPKGKASSHSTEYGEWMSQLLEVYLTDPEPLPIRVLDDMFKVLLGGMVSKEGLGLNNFGILVIDTNGTLMKNDTLKSAYDGADKFSAPVYINNTDILTFLASEEFQDYKNMQRPSHEKCQQCSALDICGGGMLLHRWENGNGFDNPSVYCADQLLLISKMKSAIKNLMYYE